MTLALAQKPAVQQQEIQLEKTTSTWKPLKVCPEQPGALFITYVLERPVIDAQTQEPYMHREQVNMCFTNDNFGVKQFDIHGEEVGDRAEKWALENLDLNGWDLVQDDFSGNLWKLTPYEF